MSAPRETNDRMLSLRLPTATWRALDDLAEREKRSVSAMVRLLLEQQLTLLAKRRPWRSSDVRTSRL